MKVVNTASKISLRMVSTPGFEPGPLWWEVRALTTAEVEENLCRSPSGLNKNSNVFRPVMQRPQLLNTDAKATYTAYNESEWRRTCFLCRKVGHY